jgi:nicotinamidase-related amidase
MPKRSIYLVMDLINDIVSESGPNAKTFGVEVARRAILDKTVAAMGKARAAGVAIGFVRVGWSPDYREWPARSPQFGPAKEKGLFKLGTWGTELHDRIKSAARPGDFDVVKHRVSPFYGTNLEPVLRAHRIERIFMSGVSTNYVVQACAREAHDRDYEVVILEDCCCALSQDEHDWAIKGLSRPARIVASTALDFSAD